jgi:hypothetical protein
MLGAGALLAAGVFLRPVTVLELENAARGATARLALREGERFSVISQHSMYDRPVTEEFVVGADLEIVLRSVSSPSAAVREYFGLCGAGERQEMERAMKEIVFRVAAGTPQRLRISGTERSFLELGDHGDRLVLRASRRPAGFHWLRSLFHS